MLFKRSKEIKPKEISYEELINLMKVDHCLVDSRGRSSYAKFHIDGAINIPDEEFTELSHLLPDSTDTPLVFYCKNVYCVLSPNSAQKAVSLGYKNVYLYKGGVEEWIKKKNIELPQMNEPGKLTKEQFIEIYKRKDDEYLIIDVNDSYDYKIKHLKGAINYPYGYIITNYNKLPKNKKLIFYCASGTRGEDIYYFLKEKNIFKDGEIFYLGASVIFNGDKAKIV
ncbi:rhodanese-like domain-containing protein [Calditerrivibrio nitroreducens]|jgi:rhodanese-related sulfurtransferase|uniref:rhodanese-like domain-containing protein n=1 Tax=Calditerrivibrio nitroreducens TaxID=477976 RepID=UPI003C77EAA7